MFAALVVLTALLSACSSTRIMSAYAMPRPLEGLSASLAVAANGRYTVVAGHARRPSGTPMDFETYTPVNARTDVMVFLAHGFTRSLANMRGWARLWASRGVPVTVMNFHNTAFLFGHFDRDALDLLYLAQELHSGPVIYAGFSAGGDVALAAAAQDGRTVAYLGLDSVDFPSLASHSTSHFSKPALYLASEPSACNLGNDMLNARAIEQRNAVVLRIANATHCYFEDPSDPSCIFLCGALLPDEAATIIRDTVRSIATAWILVQSGANPRANSVLVRARLGSGDWAARVRTFPDTNERITKSDVRKF